MSAYTTPSAVRLAANPDWQAGSPEPDAGAQDASSLSDTQLADAILEASARIDTYLGGKYKTPIAAVDPAANPLTYPDPIGYWARTIALYLATLTFLRNAPLEQTDPVALRYGGVMAELMSVRDGKTVLQLPSADVTGGSGFAGTADAGYAGLFTAADAGYHRDAYGGRSGAYPWLTGDRVAWWE